MAAREAIVNRILAQIEGGRLPPDQTEKRLQEIIDAEISRDDAPADTALIDSCLELMEQLHRPAEAKPRRNSMLNICRWAAAAAVLVLLALGLTGRLAMQWYEHGNSADGEQHTITGHEIRVDMIEKALAEHTPQSRCSFGSVQELEQELGFNPGVTSALSEGWTLEKIDAFFTADTICIEAGYRTAAMPQDCITLDIQCFTRLKDVYAAAEQSQAGSIQRINGVDVYISKGESGDIVRWVRGSTIFTLAGTSRDADLLSHAQLLIDGFASLDGDITPEKIRSCISLNLAGNESMETADYGELCDFLGFAPVLFPAEAIGAEMVHFSCTVTPEFIRANAQYADAEGRTLATFANLYYGNAEDLYFAFEETESGHFVLVNGREVYTSANINWQNYSWTQGNTVSVVYSDLDEDRILLLLKELFAGHIMTREARGKPVADITPDQIRACISQALSWNEQLQTGDFGEVCSALGFTPAFFPAEAIGADSVLFIVSPTPAYVLVDCVYRDADGNTMAIASNQYDVNPAELHVSFEQNEVGSFINIGGHRVYTSQNYDKTNYSWTEGAVVTIVHSSQADDKMRRVLADFFAGNVMTCEEQTLPVADVTPMQIEECINRNLNGGGSLQTADFHEVCGFLGFTPAIFPPEAVGASELTFIAAAVPDFIRFDAFYQGPEGEPLVSFGNLYYANPEDAYFAFEQDEEGAFIQVGNCEVYTSRNYETTNYSWAGGNTVSVLYSTLEASAIPVLEAFFAGDVYTP